MKKIYWTGISKDERIKAISEITEIVDRYAIILNFKKFSDIMLSLMLEVDENMLNDLSNDLKKIMIVEGADTNYSDSKLECTVFFSISFTKGTGDLLIEVPNIPE